MKSSSFFDKKNPLKSGLSANKSESSILVEALIHAVCSNAAIHGTKTIPLDSIRSILESATVPEQERQAVATP